MVTARPLVAEPTVAPDFAANAALTPECRGLVERPDEWWLDLIAIPKVARFMTWRPRSPSYRRGWTFELPPDARFDVRTFQRYQGQAAVAVVMAEPPKQYIAGWFAAEREAEARSAAENLNREIAALWRHWRAFGRDPLPQRQVTFEQGHEHAPDARWGLQVFTLADDGRYSYVQRRAGKLFATGAGTVEATRASAVFDDLARSTFPQVAAHPFPPGASVLTISMPPERTVELDRRFGLGLNGYREAITSLMDMVAAARTTVAEDDGAAPALGSTP